MLVLGIESSCDDTAAAVVEDGHRVLSSVISSQDRIHAPFGGVVPEMASRSHLEKIEGTVTDALAEAGREIGDMDLIAVTEGPGLIGSLLVGLSFAKGLSFATGIPVVLVDHIRSHLMTLDLAGGTPTPSVILVASGGHTTLFHLTDRGEAEVIGTTLDDAAGEALDKAAKLLGLGYPGGPEIERAARRGGGEALRLPRPLSGDGSLNFSFSGLKTALFTYMKRNGYFDSTREGRHRLPLTTQDLAASFQAAVVDVLVDKTLAAADLYPVRDLAVVGGVARNGALREMMSEKGSSRGLAVHFPPPALCTDNAAMVAALGFRIRSEGSTDVLSANAFSTKSLKLRGPHRKAQEGSRP